MNYKEEDGPSTRDDLVLCMYHTSLARVSKLNARSSDSTVRLNLSHDLICGCVGEDCEVWSSDIGQVVRLYKIVNLGRR
jgi:hypothetical protein